MAKLEQLEADNLRMNVGTFVINNKQRFEALLPGLNADQPQYRFTSLEHRAKVMMENTSEFGGQFELYSASQIIQKQIMLHQDVASEQNKVIDIYGQEFDQIIHIKFQPIGNASGHYDAMI